MSQVVFDLKQEGIVNVLTWYDGSGSVAPFCRCTGNLLGTCCFFLMFYVIVISLEDFMVIFMYGL